MTLGKKLALQRKAVGMTLEEVALKIRVTPQTLADWENNIGEPSIQNLVDFALLFGASLDDLLDTGMGSDDDAIARIAELPLMKEILARNLPLFSVADALR